MIHLAPDAEILSRFQHATHFRNADGKRVALFGKDVNYLDAGQWAGIDLSFEQTSTIAVAKRIPHRVEVSNVGVTVLDDQGKGVRWLTPSPPMVSRSRASYAHDGLSWAYDVRKNGIKLEATVPATRGSRTYEFTYQMVGLGDWQVTPEGNLLSGNWLVKRPHVVDANGVVHDCGPWQAKPGPKVAFSFDDTGIPTPYVLDPSTTFEPSASGDDGYVTDTAAGYPPNTGSASVETASTRTIVNKGRAGEDYQIQVALTRWDTSTLDNGVIVTAADVRLYVESITDTDSRSITAEWYYTWPIAASSYTTTVGTDAHSGTAISGISTAAYNTFTLSAVRTGVKSTDYTGLRFHVNGGAPTNNNAVNWYSFDAGSNEPQLVVTYDAGRYYMIV